QGLAPGARDRDARARHAAPRLPVRCRRDVRRECLGGRARGEHEHPDGLGAGPALERRRVDLDADRPVTAAQAAVARLAVGARTGWAGPLTGARAAGGGPLAGGGGLGSGGGGGPGGSAGEGGPAAFADLSYPMGIALDARGNLLIADFGNFRVRKVDTTRFRQISTIAGNGVDGFSGDGGPATAAAIQSGKSIAAGAQGKMYPTPVGPGPEDVPIRRTD